MKHNIKIGNMVDDGTGDYLREGGKKINDNFDELYYQLGDGDFPHAAGAWKTWSVLNDGSTIDADWGKSYAIDTTSGPATVRLPKGDITKYNYVIRLRDVFGIWQRNNVTLIPSLGDTLKGSPDSHLVTRNFADLELVYCAPGRWEWVDNKQVDRITSDDISSVVRKAYVATQGQQDFMDVLDGYSFNKANTYVFLRGNVLHYYNNAGGFDADSAEVGSPGTTPGEIVEFNGKDIRIKIPVNEGDTVLVLSYIDGVAQWRSSYNKSKLIVLDSRYTDKTSIPGTQYVESLEEPKNTLFMTDFAIDTGSPINPNSLQVYYNSTLLNESGTLGLPTHICSGAFGETPTECVLNGGEWVDSNIDYTIINNADGLIDQIVFGRNFENNDIITLVWFNNDIGTVLELEDLERVFDDRYVSASAPFTITGDVLLTDFDNVGWPNVEAVPDYEVVLSSAMAIASLVYPVGTIYENAVNPNNPATYLGFGSWKRYGEGRLLAGFSSDANDSDFGRNNNDLDTSGVPSTTAGGTGGERAIYLENVNLPKTSTDDKVLIVDENGPIVVGGCQFDPDEEGPAYTKYKEDYATTNKANDPNGNSVKILPPYITVYRWVRIS